MHAAESTHYYTRDGKPAYTVVGANGKERPTNVRDARKLGLVPSVTTVIRCAAAPGLEIWKQQQVLLAALTLPRADGESEQDLLSRIMDDSKRQAKDAAERGSRIHAEIQSYFEGSPPVEMYWEHCQGAARSVREWHNGEWFSEKAFSHSLGFGGKVDLHCHGAVLDFKTKEFDTTAELKVFDEHAMQLAAYRHGLGMDNAKCAIVYVSASVPGLCKLIEIPEEDLSKGWTMFYSLLHYWQAKNVYRSSFERMAA